MANQNDDFEVFRGDLIAYLARKLHLSQEDVTAKLGTVLVEQLAGVAGAGRAQDLVARTRRKAP